MVGAALTPARTRGRGGGEGSAGPQQQRRPGIASPWPSTTRTLSSAASRRAWVSPGGWGDGGMKMEGSPRPISRRGASGRRARVWARHRRLGARAAVRPGGAGGGGAARAARFCLPPSRPLLFSFYFPVVLLPRRALRIQQHLGASFWLRDKSYLPDYPCNTDNGIYPFRIWVRIWVKFQRTLVRD